MAHPRRLLCASAGALLALGLAWGTINLVATELLRRDTSPGAGFCLALHEPRLTEHTVRRAIEEQPDPAELDLVALRAASTFFYGPKVADGAPDGYEDDAHLVLSAIRQALRNQEEEPIDRPEVQEAIRRFDAEGDKLCEGVL